MMLDSNSVKLMLVEGEPILADLTSFRLELLGYQIQVVASAMEAMRAINDQLPDLLIIDSVLPDGDGIEFISKLRSQYSPEQLPILVFSIDPSLENVERAVLAGAQDYLVTPFDPTVLEDKIQLQLQKHETSAQSSS